MYNRTLCDFNSRAEFDAFVDGLRKVGYSYRTEYVSNLPCEGTRPESEEAVVDTSSFLSTQNQEPLNIQSAIEQPSKIVIETPKLIQDTMATSKVESQEYADIELEKRYKGKVGKLEAIYNIKINKDQTVAGTYFYSKRPNIIYKLDGVVEVNGHLKLSEYTKGAKTATCALERIVGEDCFLGKMYNTDGRSFEMSICE